MPILGTGGLMSWTDVVEMLMFGATAVSFCSLLMLQGFEALQKVERGLRRYMEQHDYRKLDDFRNAALSCVAPSMADCDVISSVAKVDREKCNGCGRCLKLGHCVAISLTDQKAEVSGIECLGCGACFTVCPCNAVSMVELR
jgi:ferredoxin